jgi:DNA polymerase/3'-5' exonuclease PolX
MFRRKDFIELVDDLSKRYYMIPTGSYKRESDFINDLDFLTYNDPQKIYENMKSLYNMNLISNGPLYVHFKLWDIIDVNIWKINKENDIFQKLGHDYDKQLQISLRRKAKNMGYKLTSNGLFNSTTNKRILVKTIRDIFTILDVAYRSPTVGHLGKKINI